MGGGIGWKRTFNTVEYGAIETFSKVKAQTRAKQLRANGIHARVIYIPSDRGWAVFSDDWR